LKVFDNNKPWHFHTDFLFGFVCNRCENEMNLEDIKSGYFVKECIEMSELTQQSGCIA